MTISFEVRNHGILAPATALPILIKGTMLSEASLYTLETQDFTIAVQQFNAALFSFIVKSCIINQPAQLITATDTHGWLIQILLEGHKLNIEDSENAGVLYKNQLMMNAPVSNCYTTIFKQPGNYTIVEAWISESFMTEFITLFPSLNTMGRTTTLNPVWLDTVLYQYINSVLQARLSGTLWNYFIEARVKDILFHIGQKLAAPVINHHQLEEYEIIAVNKAAQLIKADITKHIPIPELSKKVQLNDFKLKKYFRQIHGMGIYEFLIHHRMLKAKELLEQNLSVKEVAAIVGYRPSDLTVVFLQYFGMNPSEVRNSNK